MILLMNKDFDLSDISKRQLFSRQVNVNMTVQVSKVIMSVMRMIVITFKLDNKFIAGRTIGCLFTSRD